MAAPRSRGAYYAGAERYVPIPPTDDPREFLRELRSAGAEFLVLELERVPARLRHGAPGLRPIHRVPYPGGAVVVFRNESLSAPGTP